MRQVAPGTRRATPATAEAIRPCGTSGALRRRRNAASTARCTTRNGRTAMAIRTSGTTTSASSTTRSANRGMRDLDQPLPGHRFQQLEQVGLAAPGTDVILLGDHAAD